MLRFEPIAGASHFAIESRLTTAARVAQTIERPPIAMPAGVLKAGIDYIWTVRVAGDGPPAQSEGRFHTLDAEAEAARSSLAGALDPAGSGLLGGIDLNLGLLNEAIAELTAAADRNQGNAAARAAAGAFAHGHWRRRANKVLGSQFQGSQFQGSRFSVLCSRVRSA